MKSEVVHILRYNVCNVVVFLARDQAGYMTSQAINITGG